MASSIAALPFKEQIDFFRQKKLVPTNKWDDLLRGDHDHGFMVAGANRGALLVDLKRAVDKAIAQGASIGAFRKDFDQIVKKHGWAYNGERGWRTETIYATNLTTSYAAGRYAQMTDPDMLRARPFWRYVHSDNVQNPRPAHRALDGKIVRADDPFWSTWYPPNGWGCQCTVEALGPRDLKRLGKDGPDPAPVEPGHTAGIDRGFEYAPGRSLAQGPARRALEEGEKNVEIERLTPDDFRDEPLPARPAKSMEAISPQSRDAALALARRVLGGDDKVFKLARGKATLPLRVNAEALVNKFDSTDGRARLRFLPQLVEMLADPDEIFLGFVRMKDGSVRLSVRAIAELILPDTRPLLVVAGAGEDGNLSLVTFLPMDEDRKRYFKSRRWGRRLYRRGEAIAAPAKPVPAGSKGGAALTGKEMKE